MASPAPSKLLILGIFLGPFAVLGLGFAGAVALGVVGMAPDFEGRVAEQRQRREFASNVDGIKTAMLAYEAAFDVLAPMPMHPRTVAEIAPGEVPWTPNDAWDLLGWHPSGPVHGVYWVEVDGEGFTVHGVSDRDGDGQIAEWTATRDRNATILDPSRF